MYLYLKSKFTVNSRTLETNKNNISIPTKEVNKLYGDARTFRKDIDILIDYGFIRQIVSGVPTMSVSIYGFSNNWKFYNTDKFNILELIEDIKEKLKIESSKFLSYVKSHILYM